jgi:hypothetical protein
MMMRSSKRWLAVMSLCGLVVSLTAIAQERASADSTNPPQETSLSQTMGSGYPGGGGSVCELSQCNRPNNELVCASTTGGNYLKKDYNPGFGCTELPGRSTEAPCPGGFSKWCSWKRTYSANNCTGQALSMLQDGPNVNFCSGGNETHP